MKRTESDNKHRFRYINLGEAIDVISGAPFKSELFNEGGEGLPLIRVRDVNTAPAGVFYSGGFNAEHLIQSGDLLVSMDGDFKCISWAYGPGVLNQRVCKLVPKENILNKSYLRHFLPTALSDIHRDTIFTTVKHLSTKTIKDIQIPLPHIEDQIRIAHLLGKVEGLITQRKKQLQQHDDLVNSVFLKMFGDPVRNEKGWPKRELGEVLKVKHGFAFSSEFFSDKGPFVLLTPGNFFEKGGFRNRGEKQKFYVGETPIEYVLKKDSLLIAMTEQAPGLLGSPLIVPESNLYLHNQRLGLVVEKEPIQPWFLFHLFNQKPIRQIIHSKATGTKVRHTSPSKIEAIFVGYPPIDLQNQFAMIVKKIEGIKFFCQKSLTDLEALYSALSEKAFKSQLDLSKTPVIDEAPKETPQDIFLSRQAEASESFAANEYANIANIISNASLDPPSNFIEMQGVPDLWLDDYIEYIKSNSKTLDIKLFLDVCAERWANMFGFGPTSNTIDSYDKIKKRVFEKLRSAELLQQYDEGNLLVSLELAPKGS